jgi:hypothetical protein
LARNFPPRNTGPNLGKKRDNPMDNGPMDSDPLGRDHMDNEPLFPMDEWDNANSSGGYLPEANLYESSLPSDSGHATPSLPIILLSAASGVGAGIIALYITYHMLRLPIEWSVAATVFCLSVALGSTGALLSMLTRSRAAILNIAFSCGLILVTLLFFALCTFVGAMAATFILTL